MGRKLNLSTPTVINTETIPLDESFYIVANGQTEQWFYDNNNQYAPNRKLTPLTLTPTLSVVDNDTHTEYTPTFYTVRWFVNEYSTQASDYVETEITAVADGEIDYFKSGNNLVVKKNVSYTRGVTVRCEATYIDPRDIGITYTVSDSVVLSTNRDAEIVYPTLDINAPTSRAYNPLTDSTVDNGAVSTNSRFTFPAKAEWPNDTVMQDVAVCRADNLGIEEIIPQNEESVVTCSPYLDMRYGDVHQTDQTFMYRQTGDGSLSTIDGGKSYIDAVRGKTVKWNQMVPEGKRSASRNISSDTSTYFFTEIASLSIGFIASHKYYAKAMITRNISENNGISYQLRSSTTNIMSLVLQNGEKNGYVSKIWTCETNIVSSSLQSNNNSYKKGYSAGDSFSIEGFSLIDLTAIFGSDAQIAAALGITEAEITTDTGVAAFESWLSANVGYDSDSYYQYDAGSLIPVKMTALKSVGFNLWNEQWERGYYYTDGSKSTSSGAHSRNKYPIKVLGGKTYYFKSSYTLFVYQYDENMRFLSRLPNSISNAAATLSASTRYINFYMYNSASYTDGSININLSDPSRNGTYEAHYEDIAALDVTTITGKLNGSGNSVTIFPDGMKRVGNVYDEIKVVDGVVKAVKRIGSADMGTFSYIYNSRNRADTGNIFRSNSLGANATSWLLSYRFLYNDSQTLENLAPMEFEYRGNWLVVCHTAETVAALKTALEGVVIYYGLATPQEYVIDPQSIPRNAVFEWYGIANNTEVKADTLPWYVSGQGTDILTVDSMYGENITVVLRARDRTTGNLYPNKVYRSVQWRTPDVDTHVVCKNGSAVRSNTQSMEFATVVNVNGRILDEAIKAEHLRFNWKTRKSNSQTETDMGWGLTKTIQASDLRNVRGATSSLSSTLVFPYVYLLGAYEPVERDGQTVYERSVN